MRDLINRNNGLARVSHGIVEHCAHAAGVCPSCANGHEPGSLGGEMACCKRRLSAPLSRNAACRNNGCDARHCKENSLVYRRFRRGSFYCPSAWCAHRCTGCRRNRPQARAHTATDTVPIAHDGRTKDGSTMPHAIRRLSRNAAFGRTETSESSQPAKTAARRCGATWLVRRKALNLKWGLQSKPSACVTPKPGAVCKE